MYHGAAAVPHQGVNEQGAGDQAIAACSSSNSYSYLSYLT